MPELVERVTFHSVGLALPMHTSYEDWRVAGERIGTVKRAANWWAGDWVLFGEPRYGEMYSQAIHELGLDYGTLANCVYVAKRFDLSRRHENLSWEFHYAVAKLEAAEADRLLERCETEGWDRRRLRQEAAGPTVATCGCHCHANNCTRCGEPVGSLSVDP